MSQSRGFNRPLVKIVTQIDLLMTSLRDEAEEAYCCDVVVEGTGRMVGMMSLGVKLGGLKR